MYPPVGPVLIEIGPLSLRWYGVLMVTAFIVAAAIAARYVERKAQRSSNVWDGLLWVLVGAVIGARLYYVFIQSPRGPNGIERYLTHPLEILNVMGGGLHIFGGFIGGALALLLYTRRRNLPAAIYLDGAALGMPLGQAIARLGNFINQELYGPPTTLPWGLRIDPPHRIPPFDDLMRYPESTRFHPLFLYEAIWNLVGFALLNIISRRFEKQLRDGDLILMYAIWYPLGRFFLEFLRTDSWFFPGTPFNVVHVLSFLAICGAAALLVWRHRALAKVASAQA
ncbi:MAG: prolipoprotein diacylglyceryl transferase [Chloroflexi bacterium]|jgi:phosphatidylglycerol:prolipoprotein diacylglycerol transferase|uniref:Phosphatidylglycerol--prolipoprotein diacylglyceryl transferase n=1 Tax=Candidatus Thermofonsia Clade 3 bacterium TaxID=2364212 RepID=A0A2M8QFG5_9CHLR|nr:prolipoprotein diacylglyceryl transferase [Candidatus Roseilinea sp. NK_OTU-006]PJF48550.1 MAG: prolipoprotein diacylglyceryl transferase [Candidatus Thermofonsia Clade 3 bacterium]RMG66292.1 MAG: prolipoprotein diacylglyceryl transferase [Chloroflexota bacterium]